MSVALGVWHRTRTRNTKDPRQPSITVTGGAVDLYGVNSTTPPANVSGLTALNTGVEGGHGIGTMYRWVWIASASGDPVVEQYLWLGDEDA